jgi:hypothetical protein
MTARVTHKLRATGTVDWTACGYYLPPGEQRCVVSWRGVTCKKCLRTKPKKP